ncbi:lipase/acyltransferase domain-containing protein [Phormidium tenue]|nr:lecithin--cholesterol acyltransferase [Phormidium tenue]
MPKTKMRDLVVILPGITGSVLQKDGKDIWAVSGQAAWQALITGGGSFQQLKLDHDDPELEDLGDGIKAVQVVEDAHFVPGLVKIDGYTAISQAITDSFDVIPGENFFKFPYDWRRDNRANARILKRFVEERLKKWRESPNGAEDGKVILLAHSMGGLISRYYLEVLEGWQDCRALITFGTPHRGSVNAVNFLANGFKKLFFDLTEVMRSLPSVYQLMPIYPMLKIDNEYKRIAEADIDLPNIDKAKAENALKFHHEIRDAVNSHRQDANYLANKYALIPVVGTKQPTFQSANLTTDGQIEISLELPEGADPILGSGDGTVPYISAIPIELTTEYRQSYIAERHGSIQNHGQVLDQLCNLIAAMQVRGIENFQNPGIGEVSREPAAISLDLDDLYLPDEIVEFRASIVNASEDFGKLKAKITSVSDEDFSLRADFQKQDDQWILHLDKNAFPTGGLHRLEVRVEKGGLKAPTPVHDLFEVIKQV